jgi:hypothetical protein
MVFMTYPTYPVSASLQHELSVVEFQYQLDKASAKKSL